MNEQELPGTKVTRFKPEALHKCWKPDCFRKVSTGSQYCCRPCSYADEKKFELDNGPNAHPMMQHSNPCNERFEQRGGEYSIIEAQLRKQKGAL